ncbi:valine--tRNA ligase [Buchnera aphidicola]|uniref:valine--tRNA ligase n=1 Tax=Buchnera aphidicola TaxID=9 RepID=UPI00209391EE|nr:valine--tRNA ligase [Buchnera aphidicola]USS94364.1 valine--tRNA ligase [Buchnera aphidicola (Sipha maydis)]WII23524.1 valine--tRNA ligase [Buchnera aphidicola (Sipha maydis)]
MKKKYNPKLIEKKLYHLWEKNKCFKTLYDQSSKKSFCIMMPPPNITGVLHMGHAFQQTIMDVLIRYNKMNGKNTLWQVGIDHAGIATQLLIEKKIYKKQGKLKKEYNRKYFLKKAWKWVLKYKKKIFYQMKRLGNSIDWSREKFTLDPDISYGVRKAFLMLYNKKLIYKKKKIVNYDIQLQTVISDLEVKNKDVLTKMWYIKYFFLDKNIFYQGKNYLVVATTRPETIFGDSAIAVNSNDTRYMKYVGLKVIVPIIQRVIPIICDQEIEIEKGTGCVKISPAHDFLDYKIGIKNFLPIIKIFHKDGRIRRKLLIYNYKGEKKKVYSRFVLKEFQLLDRFLARKKILELLESNNFITKNKLIKSIIPYGERSGTILEPMLTNQWFLKTSILSKKAILAVQNKEIKFFPKKYKKMYLSWMYNLEDWCISRQLWWGHRLPIWYDIKKNIYVGKNEEDIRKKNNLSKEIFLKQEKDVLDTWFSSGLWTFLALGWPKNTKALKIFHPTDVVVSGFDIIFFWIARMIMLTTNILKNKKKIPIPFQNVYITGLIRDDKGNKMSKSQGNIVDPIDLIDGISLKNLINKKVKNNLQENDVISKNISKLFPNGIKAFGADALRFTCTSLSNHSRNISWDMNRLQGYRNFCNKIWNASVFVIKNFHKNEKNIKIFDIKLSFLDQWIISELQILIKKYKKFIENYRFDIVSYLIYDFIWNKFCDWYLEISKIIIKENFLKNKQNTQYVLFYVLECLLKLSHPFLPFITEYIWNKINLLKDISNFRSITNEIFPIYEKKLFYIKSIKNMLYLKKIFTTVRSIRSLIKIKYNKEIPVIFKNSNYKFLCFLKKNQFFLKKIMYLKDIKFFSEKNKNILHSSLIRDIGESEILFPMKDVLNKQDELQKIEKKINLLLRKKYIFEKKVLNKNFLKYAPKNIIFAQKKKLNTFRKNLQNLKDYKNLLLSL